jgi:hypothetical protein
MATFTLFERPTKGDELPDPDTNPTRKPGDHWLIIERVLVDRRERQRGTFVVVGTVLQAVRNHDALTLIAFHATNKITGRGDISSQGVFRFRDFAKPVTIAIVGGTGDFKKARGTVTLANGKFTFSVK